LALKKQMHPFEVQCTTLQRDKNNLDHTIKEQKTKILQLNKIYRGESMVKYIEKIIEKISS